LTLYIDLDPREFATAGARKSEITSVLDETERCLPHGRWESVTGELRSTFEDMNYEFPDAQGLMVVATLDGELMQMLKLPRPVDREIHFAAAPCIRQLVETLPRESWCAVLVNRKNARILVGSRDELHQVKQVKDFVPGQHDQGGWSQMNYQRAIEKTVDDHLRHAADELMRLDQEQPSTTSSSRRPQRCARASRRSCTSTCCPRSAGGCRSTWRTSRSTR